MYLYQSINPNEELTIGELTGEEQKCLQLAFGKNNFLEMFHYHDLGHYIALWYFAGTISGMKIMLEGKAAA